MAGDGAGAPRLRGFRVPAIAIVVFKTSSGTA